INDEPRIYKCERIARVTLRDERFTVPTDFDLARFQRDRLRLPTAKAGTVRLRLRGDAAEQAARWPGARKRRGAVEVSLSMAPNEWLLGWILGWGGDVEALAPSELRAAVAGRLREIAERHG